jgi:ElaB/YqjD/DUF883 family membrane-anchored ribosome-binding protein
MSNQEFEPATATMPSQTEHEEGVVAQAQQQVQEKAQVVKSQVGDQLRSQVDQRSTQVGEHVHSVGHALRQSGEQLRDQGKETPAKLMDSGAQQADRLGRYLRDADADRMLRDVESWARRRPWAAASIGVVAGFLGSRFLKASSVRRYESQTSTNGHSWQQPAGLTPPPLPYDSAYERTSEPRRDSAYPAPGAGTYEARPGGM